MADESIVERVARAMYDIFYMKNADGSSAWPPDPDIEDPDRWREAARAAIATMREPVLACVPSSTNGSEYYDQGSDDAKSQCADNLRKFFDAALK